jgi:hypothetical protein
MRKHVLFFVHGMGAYVTADGAADDTWSKDAAAALEEQYNKYPFVKRRPFNERFEVVHINYDTEIFKLVKRWQDEAQSVQAAGVATAGPALKLVSWLDGGAKLEDNFAWTHAACVVLYYFFPLMRQRLKIHVAGQIQRALAPNAQGAVSTWSIIAHSLGTMVVHDVLHAMDSTTPNQAGISVLDTMVPSAQVVAMISNVCKVLENDVDVYGESLVVPQSMVRNQSCCFSYFNCNNRFDPFVRPLPFAPPREHPTWALARSNGTYLDIETANVHETNVHSLRNYLVNPDVHIPLLEHLVGFGSITDEEKSAARAGFKDLPDAVIETTRQKLTTQLSEHFGGSPKVEQWFDLAGVLFSMLKKSNA